ncbi:sugar ABC transporter ATP-binding protein [Arthrobacter sp. NPDC080073]|uniref:sugar ABC transporter ATP-binding protein n=1 Tax=Arthrobacter sp. NPDC080073 TaxID=3155919 RepID=UPI003412892B
MTSEQVVGLTGVTKRFAGQTALDGIDIDFRPGEIHGLAGMNGSGKSTLVKVLAGVHQADEGHVVVDGRSIDDMNPQKAHDLGFRFIHQDPAVFTSQTVMDNVALGARYRHSSRVILNEATECAAAREAMSRLGIEHINPRSRMGDLSQTERTMVAIARAVQDLWAGLDVRLLVMDEPTASLPENEARIVFDIVRKVAGQGVPILYITHDLGALVSLASRVTILRDGKRVDTRDTSTTSERGLATLMAGSAFSATQHARQRLPSEETPVVMSCESLAGGRVSGLDLALREGEILGIAGLLGSGRSTVMRLISGAQTRLGSVKVGDTPVPPGSPQAAVRAGIAFVPEDRRTHGAFNNMTMLENLSVASLAGFSSPKWIDRKSERKEMGQTMDAFDVRPRQPDKLFRLFSGGNQQKAIIGRWARLAPKILLLDEPTQGVDVHARVQIHNAIRNMAADGMSIVVVSSDFTELKELTDRIIVMRQGRIRSQINTESVSEDEILHLAATDEIPHSIAPKCNYKVRLGNDDKNNRTTTCSANAGGR